MGEEGNGGAAAWLIFFSRAKAKNERGLKMSIYSFWKINFVICGYAVCSCVLVLTGGHDVLGTLLL